MENEILYLKLIVDITFNPITRSINLHQYFRTHQLDEEEFVRVLEKNRIFFRFLSLIETELNINPFFLSENFKNLIKQKNTDQIIFVKQLKKVNDLLISNSVNAVFLKIDKYPDFGKDYDIYVGFNYEKVLKLFKQYNWSTQKRIISKIFNRPLLTKSDEYLRPIDLYSKFSRFNENWNLNSNNILFNCRRYLIQDIEIIIPSAEKSLLIECISSIYLNGGINLGEILNANNQIEDEKFDKNTFFCDIKSSNCESGAYIFLYILNKTNSISEISLILNSINCSNYLKEFIQTSFTNYSFPFYIPIHILCYLYFDKFIKDIKKKKDFKSIFLLFPLYANLLNKISRKWRLK